MPTKTEKDKKLIRKWTEELASARDYKDKHSCFSQWDKWRDWYRCDWSRRQLSREPTRKLPVNRIFSWGKTLVPRIYYRNPKILITPKPAFYQKAGPYALVSAKILQSVDNMLIKETNLKMTIKRAIREDYLTGVGPINIGFDSQYGYDPDMASDVYGQPTADGSTPTQLDPTNEKIQRIEYNQYIKPGMPWAMPVLSNTVLTPFGIQYPEDLPWVANVVWRRLEDVKADPKFKNTKDLKGGYFRSTKTDDTPPRSDRDRAKYVMLSRIFDKKTRDFIVIAENEVLMHKEDFMQHDWLPWEFIILNEDSEHFWGIPMVKTVEPQQLELNELKTRSSMLRRMELLKFMVKEGAMKEDALDNLLSTEIEDMKAFVMMESDVENMQQAVQILQTSPTNVNLIRELMQVDSDAKETIGSGSTEFNPRHNTTATEAGLVNRGAENRRGDERDIVNDVVIRILEKWNDYIFHYWKDMRLAEIVGPDGAQVLAEYSGEMIKGEYNIDLVPYEEPQLSPVERLNNAIQLYQNMAADPYIDPIALRQKVLENFEWIDPGIASIVRNPAEPGMVPGPEQLGAVGAGGGTPAGPQGQGQPQVRSMGQLERMLGDRGQGNGGGGQ